MTSLNKTIQGIRSYIYDLRSAASNEDLARALVKIVSEFRNRTGLQTSWQAEGRGGTELTAQQRQHVYQIVREALSNVARHADASEVRVILRYDGRAMRVSISDNGAGDVPAQGQVGRGLRNMRERAELLGAQLDITSEIGKGTTVTLEMSDAKDQIVAGR
jgi:signal transduction histidine kinase